MEGRWSSSTMTGFVWAIMVFLLQSSWAKAEGDGSQEVEHNWDDPGKAEPMIFAISFPDAEPPVIKQFTDPTRNVNLSPFQQWINANDCLQNTSSSCPGKFQLTEDGQINVTRNETNEYCQRGCADHTLAVLQCVRYMKHNYVFTNKATLNDVNYTIIHGCNSGFTGSTIISSNAANIQKGIAITIVSAVAAFILI